MRRNDVRQSKKLDILELYPRKLIKTPISSSSSNLKTTRYLFRPFSPEVLQSPKLMTKVESPKAPCRIFQYVSPQSFQSPRKLDIQKSTQEKSKPKKPKNLKPKTKSPKINSNKPKPSEIFQKIIFTIKASRSSFNLGTKTIKSHIPVKTQVAVQQSPLQNIHDFKVNSYEMKHLNKWEVIRKVLAAASHFQSLRLRQVTFSKLKERFPGVPYGLKDSKKFIKMVKEGDLFNVAKMLQENKWLAHVYDFTGQTALHWAVIRGYFDIVKLLLEFKTFVDVNDSVGRTPAFNAAKLGNFEIFTYLVEKGANLMIKTRAKTAVWQVVNDSRIERIVKEFKKRMIFRKFGLRVPVYNYS